MTDEQWLREGLADAVPEPPTNPDRAWDAERLARRRRRTTTLAVLGSAGAVATVAAVGATLALGDGGPDRATDPAVGPSYVVECPSIEIGDDGIAEGVDEPDPDAPAAVPEGATSARLCQGPGTVMDRLPDRALVSGVDRLVAAVNDLEVAPEDMACTADLGPGFRVAFGYDDESTFVVTGQLYGCRSVLVGSGYRLGADPIPRLFTDLLAEQRADG